MKRYLNAFLFPCILLSILAHSQSHYEYKIDLTKTNDNQVPVELINPQLSDTGAVFSFPRIIPGTYMISDYGRFITDLKAYDKKGNLIPVQQLNDDQWKII